MNKLSPEQIENWRKVMVGRLGPYALIMPADQIEVLRDKMQTFVNRMGATYDCPIHGKQDSDDCPRC